MLHFCTLFNHRYLTRGLALHESLKNHCDFHLYIFAFDDETFYILNKLQLPDVTLIALKEFENGELIKIKKERNFAEYCWTCTSSTILYCLQKFNLELCTYVDSDVYFYNNPEIILKEMGANSVLITEHDFSPPYEYLLEAGKYCVQFMPFKNNEEGLKVLKEWKNDCIEWCYDKFDDGKFGDQKYLDYWNEKYTGVHILQNKSAALGPWNIQQYVILSNQNKKINVQSKKTGNISSTVFYHFHGLKFIREEHYLSSFKLFESSSYIYSTYELSEDIINGLYRPYINELLKAEKKIRVFAKKGLNIHGKIPQPVFILKTLGLK